jgi:hypothetical protein
MAGSPTTRTLALLRKEKWLAAVTEKWNPHVKIRQDLFGFIDVIAVRSGDIRVLTVQATSYSNMSARANKILGLDLEEDDSKGQSTAKSARIWLESGNRIEIWGWHKKKGHWVVAKKEVKFEDKA